MHRLKTTKRLERDLRRTKKRGKQLDKLWAVIEQRLYNLGNHRSEDLMHFIAVIEAACGREAVKVFEGMQPGDVKETYADIEASRRDLGFEPRTVIDEGLPRFVEWYRDYHGV